MEEQEKHEHCWHSNGVFYTDGPHSFGEVCCWCGEQRIVKLEYPFIKEHGPYQSFVTRPMGNENKETVGGKNAD